MNLLEALISVRDSAMKAPYNNDKALRIVNKKIASLERSKTWRDSLKSGEVPMHAKHADHPLNILR